MNIKLLTEHHLAFLSLQGGCSGSSEFIHVKMPLCWKSHIAAQFYVIKGGEGRASISWFKVCDCSIS